MSYLFELATGENRESLTQTQQGKFNPDDFKPGFLTGMADFEQALNSVTRGMVAEPAILLSGAAATLSGSSKYLSAETKEKAQEFWLGQMDDAVKWRDSLKVDPTTHGMAAQIMDSLASVLPQAALTGVVGTGAISGVSETAAQVEDGKPLDTAAELGTITGVTNAVGVAMPAAFGKTLTQRVATGAGTNVLMGAAADEARKAALQDYPAEAAQYSWDDPKARAVDAVLGAAFGGLAHVTARVNPSDVDAALTVNEAARIDRSTPEPGQETAHVGQLFRAIDQVINGEPVTAALPVNGDIHVDLIAMAGNRLSRGERQALDTQIADIEYKMSVMDQQPAYTKQDFIDQARAENPRMPARKVADIAEQKAAEAQAESRVDIEAMRSRLLAQRDADNAAREAYAEISRIEAGRAPAKSARVDAMLRAAQEEEAAIVREPVAPAPRQEQPAPPTIKPPKTNKGDNTANTVEKPEAPEIARARQALAERGDVEIDVDLPDGTTAKLSAAEALRLADDEAALADKADTSIAAAITCFFKYGDQ